MSQRIPGARRASAVCFFSRTRRVVLHRITAAVFSCTMVLPSPLAGQGHFPSQVTPARYEIHVRFEPERGFLHATATVTLRVNASRSDSAAPRSPVTDIEFELNSHLKILEIADAHDRKLEWRRSGRLGSPKLSVRLAEPAAVAPPAEKAEPSPATPPAASREPGMTSATLALTFTYEGVLPRGELDYITRDGILLRDESRWYPATDLAAFTRNAITVETPHGQNWNVLAPGEGVSAGGSAVTNGRFFLSGRPYSSRSLIALPGDDSPCAERTGLSGIGSGMSTVIMLCMEQREFANTDLMVRRSSDVIFFFSELLGRYPEQRYAIVKGLPERKGAAGYSAPGVLVTSGDFVSYHGIPGYAPEFLPHEIAHQWFPIEVALAREEDGWLAEGIAEYLAWRYLRVKDPEQARLMVARAMRDALEPEPLRPLSLGLQLFGLESPDVTQKTLYQRGMLAFRTLETVIGQERVDRALREYYKRFAGRSAGIADFRKVCEDISQRDLGWFFDYYINGTAVPEVTLRRLPSSAPNEYLGEVAAKNVPPDFQVRVEMKFFTVAGVVENSVALRGEVTPLSMNLPAALQRVALDPDLRVLRWTEAARRNRAQHALFAAVGDLERSGDLAEAAKTCKAALALDPDDVAANQQKIRFELARLQYRMKQNGPALAEFDRVLSARSLEPMSAEFYRAWARLYRAKILRAAGKPAAARAEVQAGLALAAPALDSPVAWPETGPKETTARRALESLRGRSAPARMK